MDKISVIRQGKDRLRQLRGELQPFIATAVILNISWLEDFKANALALLSELCLVISAVGFALLLVSWGIGSALRGAPIPFREFKEHGYILQKEAVKAAFYMAVGSGVLGLSGYIASALKIF